MLLDLVHTARVGDVYLFAASEGHLIILMIMTSVLGLACMYLANKPQPTPNRRAWELPAAKERHPSNTR